MGRKKKSPTVSCAECHQDVPSATTSRCSFCDLHYCKKHFTLSSHRVAAGVDAEIEMRTCPRGHSPLG